MPQTTNAAPSARRPGREASAVPVTANDAAMANHATSHQFWPSGSASGLAMRSATTTPPAAATSTAIAQHSDRARRVRAAADRLGWSNCSIRILPRERYGRRCPQRMVPVSRRRPGRTRDMPGDGEDTGPMRPGLPRSHDRVMRTRQATLTTHALPPVRSRRRRVVAVAALGAAIVAPGLTAAADGVDGVHGPPPRLTGRAVLPVETYAPGPPAGAGLVTPANGGVINGIHFPTPSQPVEGFSGIVAGERLGEYLAIA